MILILHVKKIYMYCMVQRTSLQFSYDTPKNNWDINLSYFSPQPSLIPALVYAGIQLLAGLPCSTTSPAEPQRVLTTRFACRALVSTGTHPKCFHSILRTPQSTPRAPRNGFPHTNPQMPTNSTPSVTSNPSSRAHAP
jgi:hypothetical protein